MALSHVRSASAVGVTQTTETVSIDCTSLESERALIVVVSWWNISPARTISTATYDGVALTHLQTVTEATGWLAHALYWMPESALPASGSKTVSVSLDGSASFLTVGAALAESDGGAISVLDSASGSTAASVNTLDVTYDNTGKAQASTLVYDSSFDYNAGAQPTFSPDDSQTEAEDYGITGGGATCLDYKSVSSSSTFTQSHTSSATTNYFFCLGAVLDAIILDQDITAPLITASGENAPASISRTKDVTGALLTASGLIPSDTIDNGTVITGVLLTASGLNPSSSIAFDQILTAPVLTATGIQSPDLSYDQFITGTLQTASGDIAGSISYDQLVTAILLQASGPIVPTFTFSQSVSGVVLSATGLIAAENIKNVWGNTDTASALTWSNTDASTSLTWGDTD